MTKPFALVLKNGAADVNKILAGLGELPGKVSYHMIREVESQWDAYKREQAKPAEGANDGQAAA